MDQDWGGGTQMPFSRVSEPLLPRTAQQGWLGAVVTHARLQCSNGKAAAREPPRVHTSTLACDTAAAPLPSPAPALHYTVPSSGDGFSGTDHVYYITAKKTGSCGDNTIAYTIICHMEPFTFRPNVASINLCPRFWTLGEPLGSKQVSALVHEMIHGLVSAAA